MEMRAYFRGRFVPVLVGLAVLLAVVRADAATTANNQSASAAQGDVRRALPTLSCSMGTGYKCTIVKLPDHGILEYQDASGVWRTFVAGTAVSYENKGFQCYYTPAAGYTGSDSFTWKVTDLVPSDSNVATYSLAIGANSAPVANSSSVSTVQDPPFRVSARLSYTDPDAGQPFAFTLLSGPAHGRLEWYDQNTATYKSVVANAPVCSPLKPYDSSGWYYIPAAGYSGTDAFTWKMSDGITQSGTATVSITVIANHVPVACDQKAVVIRNDTNNIRAFFSDVDSNQSYTASVVTQPAHGNVTVQGTTLRYVSSGTYTGTDSFTWKMNDGIADSGTATCRLLVRDVGNRGGLTVLIVVRDTLLPEISTEINRLKTDIQNDGYTAKTVTFNGSTAKGLWDFLKAEYDTAGQFMSGAILVGNLPFYIAPGGGASQKQDWIFWNMQKYSMAAGDLTDARHIWVSRFFALDQAGGQMMAGSEVTLIRRALQANHDYRTGASRLPLAAWMYDSIGGRESVVSRYLDLFPEARVAPGVLAAFKAGGMLLDETSHGNTGGTYYDNNVTEYTLHDGGAQVRFALCSSCYAGQFGGVVNNQIYTRGGGNIFSVAGTCIEVEGTFSLVDKAFPDATPFRARLAAGEAWGDCLASRGVLHTGILNDYSSSAAFHGDLSVKAKVAPANQMPVISGVTADRSSGIAPFTVTLTTSASDADGTIANYEWFLNGYDYGRKEPQYTGSSNSRTVSFALAHRYPVRVQAIDNYRAWVAASTEVVVAADSTKPIRVRCGKNFTYYTYGWDYTNAAGDVWLHDQAFTSGTWGYSGGNEGYVNAAVSNTVDDALFQYFRSGSTFTYRVPVTNGTYWLNLHLADMQSSGSGQRIADIDVEGVTQMAGLDVFAQLGGKAAGLVALCAAVTDGELTFTVKKNAASPNDVFLNSFEIMPYSGGNRPPVAQSQSVSTMQNTGKSITLVAMDADGDAMTYSVVTPPAHGTLSGTAPALTYTPVSGFAGADSFVFRANDGRIDGNGAVVSIDVKGLMAHWKLDETSGTSVSDASGNGYAGTLQGAAAWTTGGRVGGALQLSTTNDMFLNSAKAVPLGAEWTIGCWFTAPLPSTGNWHTMTRASASAGDHHIILDSSLNLGMYDNTTAGLFRSSGYNMSGLAAGWHHLAAVGSGTTTRFYVDGVLAGTSDRKGEGDIYAVGNYQGKNQRFTEKIDDIRVYNYALGVPEIAALANPGTNQNVDAYGIPDAWKIQYFGSAGATNAGAMDDADGDGMCNLAEYVAGTSPANATEVLRVQGSAYQGGTFGLSFGTVTGRLYSVKYCDDLQAGSWGLLVDNVAATNNTVQVTDTNKQMRRFYKVGVKLP